MTGLYETWARKLRASWAASPAGGGFLGAIGYLLGDLTLSEGEAALLEQIPSTATDQASLALALAERQIEAGPALSFADQQALAMAAPNINRFRGKGLGLCLALYYAGFPGAVVVQQNGLAYQITATPVLDDLRVFASLPLPSGWAGLSWFTITTLSLSNRFSPAQPWWTFDNNTGFCSRFAVLFWLPDPAVQTPDPQLGTATNLARAQRAIKAWRGAKASCVGIYVCSSGKFVGWPVRNVNDGGLVGPSTVTSYAGA